MAIKVVRLVVVTAALSALTGCSDSKSVGVTIAPSEAEAPAGGTVPFSAAVTGTSNTAVLWSVAETTACGSVSQFGLFAAPPDPTTCHVVVTSAADPRRTATATVVVSGPSAVLTISPDPAAVTRRGTQQFTVSPTVPVAWSVVQTTATAAPLFPLAVSPSGRYVVDAASRPWRVQADAAWFISARATPAQLDTYLAARKAQGFNAFYLMAMVHPGGYSAVPNAPQNYAGVAPFTTPGDLSTPNEPYWAWIDTIIDRAASQGMAVMFAYAYLGFEGGNQGWATEVAAQTAAKAFNYGVFLGTRYKTRPNIIWFTLGDYTPPAGSTLEARTLSIIDGIRSVVDGTAGAPRLFMAEPSGGNSNPVMDAPAFASRIDLNSFYGYGAAGNGVCYPQADRAYSGVAPPKPAWLQEGGYEFENNTGNFQATSWETRRSRLWSVLGGGTAGDGFGSRDAYQWISFPAGLNTLGATFSKAAFELFATVPWWDLLPSGTGVGHAGRTLVSSGGGTFGGVDYVTSAVTSTGSHLLAYIPTSGGTSARSIAIDMTALNGSGEARWWDPATGATTTIGAFSNTGSRTFTSPGANGGGQNDWVLILDATGTGPCGSISSSGLYTAPAALPLAGDCRVKAVLQSDPTVVAFAQVTVR